jgi:hypothetical protein
MGNGGRSRTIAPERVKYSPSGPGARLQLPGADIAYATSEKQGMLPLKLEHTASLRSVAVCASFFEFFFSFLFEEEEEIALSYSQSTTD